MNEPKVPMYSSEITQVCGSDTTARMVFSSMRYSVRLSMYSAAPRPATASSTRYIAHTQ
ncbi:Uncharacterised protein [Mycobacterium tuberculosis]|uniref:Uncharacterized protein n=1 Tax=Mycobacterium tuberculosis TaxID=1773 RepID=A0A655JHD4_MYCTX|nr:Uncharacterised protein [Mycobacterium tuberculosis]CKV15605.1 Uncharacterised protein [Mycobacterium tuberculosis]COW93408.1 Uncharacterised protein [Mycobacterium tuberculosis]SGO93475.1 Uncharacterised protein [Mycobacterium tuberculosis]